MAVPSFSKEMYHITMYRLFKNGLEIMRKSSRLCPGLQIPQLDISPTEHLWLVLLQLVQSTVAQPQLTKYLLVTCCTRYHRTPSDVLENFWQHTQEQCRINALALCRFSPCKIKNYYFLVQLTYSFLSVKHICSKQTEKI